MRKIYEPDKRDIVPSRREILAWQNIPEHSASFGITRLIDAAADLFQELAAPRGLVEDFDAREFPDLYKGKGLNAHDGPVPLIAARADKTALMAATMGEALAGKCRDFLKQGNVSLGYMLNVVSSAGAERLGGLMCRVFLERLRSEPCETRSMNEIKVQYYCPGHCGWHISGQEKLLGALRADEIRISLGENWVLRPFKSVSGVLIAAPLEIHRFEQDFSFCALCREHKCIERFNLLESDSGSGACGAIKAV